MPKLSERFIAGLMPEPGRKDRLVFDTEVRGLGLRVTSAGSRNFIVQWTDPATKRKAREPLGAWGSVTLEQARTAARARLGRVAAGFDPKAEREARKAEDDRQRAAAALAKQDKAFTLNALVADWARLHLAGKRPRYASEAERALRTGFAADLAKPASALDHGRVLAVIDELAAAGRAAMASRTMAYGRACFSWALKRRRLAINPFAGLPAVEGGSPQRDRVLNDAEIGAIWRAAGTLGQPFGPVLRVLILTAQRREEVAGMRWSEISADGKTWTLPAARAKNGKAHVVHLSEPARAVLAGVPRVDGVDLIFTTTGKTAPSGFSRAKLAADAAIEKAEGKPLPGWRLHDFRRSAVTWLAGAGFAPHVCDRLLNHVEGTIRGVAAVYQRHEFLAERATALDAWGAHVVSMGEGQEIEDKVVPLRAGRRA